MVNTAAAKTFTELQKLDVRNPKDYLRQFFEVLAETKVTIKNFSAAVEVMDLEICSAIRIVIDLLSEKQEKGKKVMVIGNGGSAGIAMHTLADYANAGGFKIADFYNPALLTCMSNDYGYENVFVKPIEMCAESGDILFAISSSGRSPNIVKAAEKASLLDCAVITFSGFDADNPLRQVGNINFYSPSNHYGFVELSHQTLIHCILDLFVRYKVYEEMRQAVG